MATEQDKIETINLVNVLGVERSLISAVAHLAHIRDLGPEVSSQGTNAAKIKDDLSKQLNRALVLARELVELC